MSQQFIGSDPDQLDRTAGQMSAAADALDRICAQLSAQLGSVNWTGVDSERFRGEWSSQYRPALATSAQFLAEAADGLVLQAQQQREASGAASASLPHRPSGGVGGIDSTASSATGIAAAWTALAGAGKTWNESWSKPGFSAGKQLVKALKEGPKASWVSGDYTDAWNTVIDFARRHHVPDSVTHFKDYGFLHHWDGPAKEFFGEVHQGLKPLGLFGDTVGMAGHVSTISEDYRNEGALGFGTVTSGADMLADGLKMGKATYLGGMALQSVNEAAKAAGEADFSEQGRADFMYGVQNFTAKDWCDVASDTAKDMVKPLARIFL